MNNKKNKQKWLNIQDNKAKCCANCSQLEKDLSGNYKCMFSLTWNNRSGACFSIDAKHIFKPRRLCFEKYNGKNIKNGIRFYNGCPSILQKIINKAQVL